MHNKTHETFCDYDLTNLLTKLGFDWKDYFVAHDINEHFHWEIPLHIAQKWLREVKNTHIIVTYNPTLRADYVYDVFVPCKKFWLGSTISYNTYEEALESAIKKALEIILEKEE